MYRLRDSVLLVLTVGLVATCGGETPAAPDPSPPPMDASPGGIFHGDINGCSVCPVDMIMLVSELGQWISADPEFLEGASVGMMTVSGISINSTRELYTGQGRSYGYPPTAPAERDTPNEARSFVGTVSPRATIQGVFIHGVGATINGTYDSEYETDSSLQALAGSYGVSDATGFTLSYSFDASGSLSGSDSQGCMASGQASIIDPDYNMYALQIDFSQCGADGADGRFMGLASLLPTGLWLYGVDANATKLVALTLPPI